MHNANATAIQGNVASSATGPVSPSFTPEQYHQLLSILTNANPGTIDSASPLENPEAHLAGKSGKVLCLLILFA